MSSDDASPASARDVADEIYIGTILLDLNRWGRPKTPSYRVGDWLHRFVDAGFDGMELWEYHATMCGSQEVAVLETSPVRVAVYNTYCGFDHDTAPDRIRAAHMTARLKAPAVKFNLGRDPGLRDVYLRNVREWAQLFPEDCRLLCECHGGTIIEEPEEARKFFDEVDDERIEIIVHCFGPDLDRLMQWFAVFGPKITHSHVQLRDAAAKALRLDRKPEHVKQALRIMREEGYRGSFTLEFTEGTRAPDEDMEDLWTAALADLQFLRESL